MVSANGEILWNGNALDMGGLLYQLQTTLRYPVEPELQFQPDPQAPYDTTAKVLQTIKGSGVTKFGFVGNEAYSEFNRAANSAKP